MSTSVTDLQQRKDGLGTFSAPLIERIGIDMSNDYRRQQTIQTVYPEITGAPAMVQVGVQDHQGGGVRWSVAQLFDPTSDKKLDVRGDNLTGSLFSYRIYSDVPSLFEFAAIELEYVEAGRD